MLKEELKIVADKIESIIKNDSFPNRIEPEALRNAVIDYPLRGGKRLRPALVLWSCGLLGGDVEKAMNAACAVEIYHNWTLVHDDIIDNDDFRRNEPTTHIQLANYAKNVFNQDNVSAQKYGQDFAILAGDIQQGWAMNFLLNSTELGVDNKIVIGLTKRMQSFLNRGLISGEALDVEFAYKYQKPFSKMSINEIENMLNLKTGVLLQYCMETGATIALNCDDVRKPQIANLAKAANLAGLAFQLKDDLLGIFGDEKELGKPICSDITEGKPTTLLISTLNNLNINSKNELLNYVNNKSISLTQKDKEKIKDIIVESKADKIILNQANQLIDESIKILNSYENNRYKNLLEETFLYFIERKK